MSVNSGRLRACGKVVLTTHIVANQMLWIITYKTVYGVQLLKKKTQNNTPKNLTNPKPQNNWS